MRRALAVALTCGCLCVPAVGAAQTTAVEVSGGHAAFMDEAPIHHATGGASFRWGMARRLSIGPEFVAMRGPGKDRDIFLTGKVTFDILPLARVSPYLVADAGIMWHSGNVPFGTYWSREGAVSVGAGVRAAVTGRVYVGAEARLGWEPHLRVTGVVGWALPPG